MKSFLKWLATSPVATALKIGLGAALGWTLDNVAGLNLGPLLTPVVIALVTIAINALNKQDTRYGKKAVNVTNS
jgi:hypothetical protein